MPIVRINAVMVLIAAMLGLVSCTPPQQSQEVPGGWPSVSQETRPWTRWWWHGSAVTKEGITSEMEAYAQAGIGGLEITPIYGVYGGEDDFVSYLSPEWMDLFAHVLKEAERLNMGIDMATGTGWPFGGPWVENSDACKNLQHMIYYVDGGSRLQEKIEFVPSPYLRIVGNNVHIPGDTSAGVREPGNISAVQITDLVDPVQKNPGLQKLAIDQVQFEKPLKLRCLIAYGDKERVIDLTGKVNEQGALDWTAPEGPWQLYAVFEGLHGKMVERAGPGGEGNVIDHFSGAALKNYLARFDVAFKDRDISSLRAFFNDSYEVDDARGAADFTPALFEEFIKRRGYDLRNELPALFGQDSEEKNRRVLCDYRETISDLLLENFTAPWKEWAHKRDALVRNQAHGAPSNILDLYAVVDIPEIEGTEPLRFKMATSSGNVTGKRLISAEAATWLNEHFESGLGDIRGALDNFMLHGVNHLVYHGTCYSPPGEMWPGRLFYAAVHLNPRNPQWRDFHALNDYVMRCQAFLQNSSADNDILLYYPIYDRFSEPGAEMVEHFDGIGTFKGSSFEHSADLLLQRGFGFDYISDKQLQLVSVQNNLFKTSGNGYYKVVVVPRCDYMPLETLKKLLDVARNGGQVFFLGSMPRSASGFANLAQRNAAFQETLEELRALQRQDGPGRRTVQVTDNLGSALLTTGARREMMYDLGLQCIRKKNADGDAVYLIKNGSARSFEGWLPIGADSESLAIFDPVSGRSGKARIRKENSRTEVFLRMHKSQTLILAENAGKSVDDPFYDGEKGEPVVLKGKWRVSFENGGPELPTPFESDSLIYWTSLRDSTYQNFSGTATYSLTFSASPGTATRWLLEIDSVKESVEVILNGRSVGTAIGPVYQVEIRGSDLRPDETNELELKVSNLMANRIAYMDRNKIFWKKFYNVNFPARLRENSRNNIFDASDWKPRVSGIRGNVRLIPIK